MAKLLTLFAVLVAARFYAAPADDAADDAADDSMALAGQWTCTAETFDGEDVPANVVGKHTFTFKDDTLTVRGGLAKLGCKFVATKSESAYKVTLGNGDKHKTIDLKEDKDGGRTIPGLYKIEKGNLTLVLNYKNTDRPEGFEGKADSGVGVFTFEKTEKPGKK
jgi:uncharacterized protein (TIGR03067 family)